MIKYSYSILMAVAGCAASLLQAYPNEIYIKNSSGLKIYFVADVQRDTPKTTAEYWGSLGDRVEEIQPYHVGQIQEPDKGQTYTSVKALPVDWQPHPRMTGQRRPVWADYQFELNATGPIYLIYSDSGFKVVSKEEWARQKSR